MKGQVGVKELPDRPFHNFRALRSGDWLVFLQFRGVARQILKPQNCEKVGRALLQHESFCRRGFTRRKLKKKIAMNECVAFALTHLFWSIQHVQLQVLCWVYTSTFRLGNDFSTQICPFEKATGYDLRMTES